jgi:hypothetical protein
MCFWDKKFVLRTTEVSPHEAATDCYQVYRFASQADDLTPADNYFDTTPYPASMKLYDAVPLEPPHTWQAKLATVPPVWLTMGVFQLRSKP